MISKETNCALSAPRLLLIILSWISIGCGGSSTPSLTAVSSCNFISVSGGCHDYGRNYEAPDVGAQADCLEDEGVFSNSACPTTNRVGTCYSTVNELAIRFYSTTGFVDAWTVATARNYCQQGTFVAN